LSPTVQHTTYEYVGWPTTPNFGLPQHEVAWDRVLCGRVMLWLRSWRSWPVWLPRKAFPAA